MNTENVSLIAGMLNLVADSRIADVRVGPAGIHMDLDYVKGCFEGDKPRVTFWLQGGVRIRNKNKELFSCPPCPLESIREHLSELLIGRRLIEAELDTNHNVLRISLDEGLFLSVYPSIDENERFPWILYLIMKDKVKYAVVELDGIKLFNEANPTG